jgi:hypothetical protein
MVAGETPGPSGSRPDRYFEDISADELSTNAPADETNDHKNARRERNRKWNERHRRLRESLPIWNLTEALDQVESRVHTTPEQCLMSITTIARQARGCLRVKSSPSSRRTPTSRESTTESLKCLPSELVIPTTMKPQVAVQQTTDATVLEENCPRTPTIPGFGRWAISWCNSAGGTSYSRGPANHGDAGGGGSCGGSSSHRAGRRAGGGGDHGGRGHANSHVTGASHGGYAARHRIEEIRHKKSSTAGENDGFPTFFARLRSLLLL